MTEARTEPTGPGRPARAPPPAVPVSVRLAGACPAHLAGARRRVMDRPDPALVRRLAEHMQSVAGPPADRPSVPCERGTGHRERPTDGSGCGEHPGGPDVSGRREAVI